MRHALPLLALMAGRAFAPAAPPAGFSGEGTFFLYLNEERAGRITFRWNADGSFEGKAVMTIGAAFERTLAITPDAEGRWVRSVFENRAGKTVVERKGNHIAMTAPFKKGSGTVPEETLVFEESSPALISQALSRYEVAKSGRQTFFLVEVSKADAGPVTLQRLDASERSAGGRNLKLIHWLYERPGCELHVLAGEDNRVYLVTGCHGSRMRGSPSSTLSMCVKATKHCGALPMARGIWKSTDVRGRGAAISA